MKILVTGNAGSGKSSFSKRISADLSIPLYGLDDIVWKENWAIEGIYKQALEKAIKIALIFDQVTRPWLMSEVESGKVTKNSPKSHFNN